MGFNNENLFHMHTHSHTHTHIHIHTHTHTHTTLTSHFEISYIINVYCVHRGIPCWLQATHFCPRPQAAAPPPANCRRLMSLWRLPVNVWYYQIVVTCGVRGKAWTAGIIWRGPLHTCEVDRAWCPFGSSSLGEMSWAYSRTTPIWCEKDSRPFTKAHRNGHKITNVSENQ